MERYVKQIEDILKEHVPENQKETLWVRLMAALGSAEDYGHSRTEVGNAVSKKLHAEQ
jgi:hypothetical protein